jgi:hypothetical protein
MAMSLRGPMLKVMMSSRAQGASRTRTRLGGVVGHGSPRCRCLMTMAMTMIVPVFMPMLVRMLMSMRRECLRLLLARRTRGHCSMHTFPRATAGQLKRVEYEAVREERVKTLAHCAWAARERDDERAAERARDGPRERAERRVRESSC